MDAFWYFLRDLFEGIFRFVPFMGLWFNKFLIVIGFVAFFSWLSYMRKHQEVEKWD